MVGTRGRFSGLYKQPQGAPPRIIQPMHLEFCLSLLRRHHSLLHPDRRRASAFGRADLRNLSPSRSCTGSRQIMFLGSALRDCSPFSSWVVLQLPLPGTIVVDTFIDYFIGPTTTLGTATPSSTSWLQNQFTLQLSSCRLHDLLV